MKETLYSKNGIRNDLNKLKKKHKKRARNLKSCSFATIENGIKKNEAMAISMERDEMDTENYYERRMDKIFGGGSLWKHRTLRTLFDPYSSEWYHTTYDKKLEIIKQIIENGETLESLIEAYKDRYLEQNRKDIARSVEAALIQLLEHKTRN